MTELKPCPFCGGEATLVEDIFNDRLYNYVICSNDDCDANTGRCDTEDEAITKWNNRTSSWHTGTPTEEGWYLLKMVDEYGRITYGTNYLRNGIKGMEWKYAFFGHVIIKWQSIQDEPEVMMCGGQF